MSTKMMARSHEVRDILPCVGQATKLVAIVVITSLVGLMQAMGTVTADDGKNAYPTLDLVEGVMLTSLSRDFSGHHGAFVAAHHWQRQRLLDKDQPSPYLGCADYGQAQDARKHLEHYLSTPGIYSVSNTQDHGACFVVTALPTEAEIILDDPSAFGLRSAGPFLSTLKFTPGLLDEGKSQEASTNKNPPSELRTTHGRKMKIPGIRGLTVRLSPGVMKARDTSATVLIKDWHSSLLSTSSVDMRLSNFWSDPHMLEGEDGHMSHQGGKLLAQEWTRAADVVRDMTKMDSNSVSEVCGWSGLHVQAVDHDVVLVTGIDHLLPGDEESETQIACFMGLLSHITSKPEVLRVSPLHEVRLLNNVGSAILQSANIVDTPLQDAGLDGTGEVIQIIDTGLDETSCFFLDEDGLEIEHGFYYAGLFAQDGLWYPVVSSTDSFYYDLSRRKIVQYIELFKAQDPDATDPFDTTLFYYYSEVFGSPYGYTAGFDEDEYQGHGTHTAGTAAGATATDFIPVCSAGYVNNCAGSCMTTSLAAARISNGVFDVETYCPAFDCDGNGATSPNCLSDDVTENLNQGGGIASGAKLAIFDVSHGDSFLPTDIGNDLWAPASGTGAKVHSNSWSSLGTWCDFRENDVLYDTFMYENPENLVLFAAGNDGGLKDSTSGNFICTVLSPALGKNTLTIGATSAGPTRSPYTGEDGRLRYEQFGYTDYNADGSPYFDSDESIGLPSASSEGADIDTVAFFSGYGPTLDVRIKPELVAPGDRILSASSDGTDTGTCMIVGIEGTSMACPGAAGAAAMVRQYFADDAFYASDVALRGFCGSTSSFVCQAFEPTAATVKAMLINSANLMGGSTQPDGLRGFGRIHLEAGIPMGAQGNLALFVADASTTTITGLATDSYTFDVDGTAGEDLRATVSWIDPPSTTLSTVHLLNDLDLAVISPDGTVYYMFDSEPSIRNNNERVIVSAASVVSGAWTIEVSAKALTTTTQSYSLVVTGAFTP